MSDTVPDTKPSTRWFWVGLIVLLAVASIIFILNADGDEEIEQIPDSAITTQEERLNTDLTSDTAERLEQVRGADNLDAEDVDTSGETRTDAVDLTEAPGQ
jgi:preprotein translocase subunit SecF